MKKMVFLALTPKEADALWTVANNGRNDFLCDPTAARSYLGRFGIGSANRAIDKLAKASRGIVPLQRLPEPDLEEWAEKQFRKRLPPPPRLPQSRRG
jgi:hypothetical protein